MVRDGSGKIHATGTTEGGAWMTLFDLRGRHTPLRGLIGWVVFFKERGFRAVEIAGGAS